jgi:serine/threonine-protein kinase
MPLAVGRKLGPYVIAAPIGAGGMGEVYCARDSRLNRDVAIKVLPEHLARDPQALARFEREAKAVAALSHPNIVVLHDVGADSGINYAVTELLEGETLRERLSRNALPWRKTAEIGAAVAEGLAAAHSKGIVHQDIKPGNIFLTSDGHVKILDFGLAQNCKAPSQEEETRTLTEVSPTIMGTIGYMSPEQVRGQRVDASSDIFSLGCVLYEMVTGQRAFSGKTATDIMAAILKEEPTPVADSGKSSSPELDRVIERCLAKSPAQRFHSARDLAFALRGLAASSAEQQPAAPAAGAARGRTWAAIAALAVILAGAGLYYWRSRTSGNIDSLAVLPFAISGGGPDADYLSDGIAESLMDSLSELPNLKVMPRSAVFRYKGKEADARAAGHDLGVRAVLTGRITQRGDALIVSTELVDVEKNALLWGEQYNRKLADALAVQQDIAQQISEKLRAKLGSEQMARAAKHQTDNPEAYQLYLKGRYYIQKFDTDNLKKGFDYFRQAIALDPNYALAYDGVTYYGELAEEQFLPISDIMPKAKEAAKKALEIDDSIADSHVHMGNVYVMYDFNWVASEREYKRAIELNPNWAPAHEYYGWLLTVLGRSDEAVAEGRRAEALDPLTPEISAAAGWWLYFGRRHDEAAAQLTKCLELDAGYPFCLWVRGLVYEQQGKLSEAVAEEEMLLKLDPGWSYALSESARVNALTGRRAEARKALTNLQALAKRGIASKYFIGVVYLALGDKARALDEIEEAYADRSPMIDFIKLDPQMDSLRSEPRFQELVKKLKLQQ